MASGLAQARRSGVRSTVRPSGDSCGSTPVEGGVDNDYVWPPDPVGSSDLSGEFDWLLALDIVSTATMIVPGVGLVAGAAINGVVLATRIVVTGVRATATVCKLTTAVKAVSQATKTIFENNNIVRIGNQANGSFRISFGAHAKHWKNLTKLRQRTQPWHAHFERTKGAIISHKTNRTI